MQLLKDQYLVDADGRKKAVVMPLKRYEQLQEDLHDLAVVAERRKETAITLDELKRRLPVDLLDPVYLKAAEEAKAETDATVTKPFPQWVRAEIYDHYLSEIRKWAPDVPVSLSTENFPMWKAFGKKLGMTATNYV